MKAYHKCPCCEMPIHHVTKHNLDSGFSPLFLSYDCGSSFLTELVFQSVDGKDVFEKLKPYQRPSCIERQRTLLMKRLDRTMEARVAELENCIEGAWGIIANVSRGNWTEQHPEWQEAAIKWRDRYVITRHASMAKMGGAR